MAKVKSKVAAAPTVQERVDSFAAEVNGLMLKYNIKMIPILSNSQAGNIPQFGYQDTLEVKADGETK